MQFLVCIIQQSFSYSLAYQSEQQSQTNKYYKFFDRKICYISNIRIIQINNYCIYTIIILCNKKKIGLKTQSIHFFKFEQGHSNSVECLKFNPQNQSELVTGSHDKVIQLWDVSKLKETQKLVGHKEQVWSISYSLDGKKIFSGSPNRSILVWDTKSGKATSALKEYKNRVLNKIYWVEVSDNGMYLASGGQEDHQILWDLRQLKLLKYIQASMDIVYNINFSQQSKFFFTGDSMGAIKTNALKDKMKKIPILQDSLNQPLKCCLRILNYFSSYSFVNCLICSGESSVSSDNLKQKPLIYILQQMKGLNYRIPHSRQDPGQASQGDKSLIGQGNQGAQVMQIQSMMS